MQPGDGSMRAVAAVAGVRRRRRCRAGSGPDPGRGARTLGRGGLDGVDLPRRPGGGRAGAGAGRRGRGRAGRRPARPIRGRRADHRRGPLGSGPGAGVRAGRGRRGAARRHRRRRPSWPPGSRVRRPGRPGRGPAVRRPGRRGTARAAPARAPGQPGRLGCGDGPDRLVDPAQPLAARARLHQQRADLRGARRRARARRLRGRAPAGSPTAHEPVPLRGRRPRVGPPGRPDRPRALCDPRQPACSRSSRRRWSAATPSRSG